MEIKIKALRLRNFKGVRSAEYFFDGRNARIEGPNGSGKSTVFDAFTWLLFGKDHKGQTADTFEIKTIDPATGEPYPREDHWVEAVLTVDGRDRVLRRAWVENWVKPTGSIDEVMKGHTSAFYVDGVDVCTKKAYDAVIAGWMDEAAFKLLTNPHYFIDDAYTGWKDRRRALMELVKDAPEREHIRQEFADVIAALSGRSLEDYRRRLAAEKAANKRDLADVLSRIAGMREALPEEVDEAAVRREIAEVEQERDGVIAGWREEIATIDKALAGADEADAARKAENDAIWAEITKVQMEMRKRTAAARKAAQEQNMAHEEDVARVKANIASKQAIVRGSTAQEERARKELADMEAERGRMASRLADLGDKYRAEKARTFEYTPDTKCPYCGQELPIASVEGSRKKAEEIFIAERKAAVEKIIAAAKALKEEIGQHDARIAGQKDIIFKAAEERDLADTEAAKWAGELKRLEAIPVADPDAEEAAAMRSAEYQDLARRERELQAKALNTKHRADGTEELVQERAGIEKKIQAITAEYAGRLAPLGEKLTVNGVRRQQEALIRRKEQEAQSFADAIASGERLEARAAEYQKADIDSVEGALAGLFRVARWKMFDSTLDGGIVETCEVTTPDGVPYRSMNDAAKIVCGMDVIRVFSEHFDRVAPIFIDNAESIIQDKFGTQAQVIRLVVKDCVKITLINE